MLITKDKNLRYQQNLSGRRIHVITLNTLLVDLNGIAPWVPQVTCVLADLPEGSSIALSDR